MVTGTNGTDQRITGPDTCIVQVWCQSWHTLAASILGELGWGLCIYRCVIKCCQRLCCWCAAPAWAHSVSPRV
eukprot:scaffold16426_cov22-Tisochrysis_lutea.AAC.3